MARMLLWFNEQLPKHDLGYWLIESRVTGAYEIVENENPPGIERWGHAGSGAGVHLSGSATCRRCGETFNTPGHAISVTTEDRIEESVVELKEYVERNDGSKPCFGDVPKLPR